MDTLVEVSSLISPTRRSSVIESDIKLRHLAFFSDLATLDESNSEWREVTAGLVTLRLVDAWLLEGKSAVCGSAWSVQAVREAIAEIDSGRPARGILKSIVDVMESSDEVDVHTVVPRLMAYASNLDFEAKWRLAIDVYRTIIGHTEPSDDS